MNVPDRSARVPNASADATQSIERVWHEQRARMWRALVAWSGDPELASDAVAEAFAQALGRGEALHAPDRWIWRAAFRIAAGDLAARRPARLVAQAEPISTLPEPIVDLVRALHTLSPKQRTVAILRWYADLPTKVVADVLGCSPTTVRVHLMHARRRLRPLLEEIDA
jgi:RNA polymerase sigma-70 factor (ECF subfamily)